MSSGCPEVGNPRREGDRSVALGAVASLFSLMPAGSGPIPLERLEAAAAEEDVLVDCLIDEELWWLRRDDEPDPSWDEPYLSSLGDAARGAAIDSGLRTLIAKGMVDVDPEDPASVELLGVYALLADARSDAMSTAKVVLSVPGEPTTRFGFRRLTEVLVLAEEVSEDGFHDFAFQSTDAAAVALSSILDRRRTAGDTSGPHVRAGSVAELEPSPDGLVEEALHVASIVFGPAGEDAGVVSVYGSTDGVWAQWTGDGPRPHVIARMGAPDLFVLAADIIDGRPPAVPEG